MSLNKIIIIWVWFAKPYGHILLLSV